MKHRQHLVVPRDEAGIRLDVWMAQRLPALSRSRIQMLIRTGNALVNGQKVKYSHKTHPGEQVMIAFPDSKAVEIRPEAIPLDILYQDRDIAVINKPAGMVTHPARAHSSGTLVNALLYHCADLSGIGWELRPGIVHRLDKDTSGVLVAAKNDASLSFLLDQFKKRLVRKEYLALIRGRLQPAAGSVSSMIARNPGNRTKMSARVSRGRSALTNYRTLSSSHNISLVLLLPETGRTHQLRVHLAHLDRPIMGDRKYGGLSEKPDVIPVLRQMLHSWKLSFTHPGTRREMEFIAPVPLDMAEIMNRMGIRIPAS